MKEYFVSDTNRFFDVFTEIKNEEIREASVNIKDIVDHCHLLRFLKDVKLNINGSNTDYRIYLDPKELSSNPEWKYNSTLFFHSDNNDFTYSNLNFVYSIEQYDFMDDPILNSFGIVFFEFYNSQVLFKDCEFDNKTDRTFEIIVKRKSSITFENCKFKGDFNFVFDVGSNLIIQ